MSNLEVTLKKSKLIILKILEMEEEKWEQEEKALKKRKKWLVQFKLYFCSLLHYLFYDFFLASSSNAKLM